MLDGDIPTDPVPACIRERLGNLLFPERATLNKVREFLKESDRNARCCAMVARDILRSTNTGFAIPPSGENGGENIRVVVKEWAKPLYDRLFECHSRLDDVCGRLLPSAVSALQACHVANVVLADIGMGELVNLCEQQHAALTTLQVEVVDLRAKVASRAQISEAAELSKNKINYLQKQLRQQEKMYKDLMRDMEELKFDKTRCEERLVEFENEKNPSTLMRKISVLAQLITPQQQQTLLDGDKVVSRRSRQVRNLRTSTQQPNGRRQSFHASCGIVTATSVCDAPPKDFKISRVGERNIVPLVSTAMETVLYTITFPWANDDPCLLDEFQYKSAFMSLKEAFQVFGNYSSTPEGYAYCHEPSGAMDKQTYVVGLERIENALTLSNKVWMQNALLKIQNSEQLSEINCLKTDRLAVRKALKDGWREWSAGWGLETDDIASCWKDITTLIEMEGLQAKVRVLEEKFAESEVDFSKQLSEREAVIQRMGDAQLGSTMRGTGFWDRVFTACQMWEDGVPDDVIDEEMPQDESLWSLEKRSRQAALWELWMTQGSSVADNFQPMTLHRLITELNNIWDGAAERTMGIRGTASSQSAYTSPRHQVQAYYLRQHGKMDTVERSTIIFVSNCRNATHLADPMVLMFAYLAGFRENWQVDHFNAILPPADGYNIFPNPGLLLIDVAQNLSPQTWSLLTRVRKQLAQLSDAPNKSRLTYDTKRLLTPVLEVVSQCFGDFSYSRECYFNFIRALLEFSGFHHPEGLRELAFFSHCINAQLSVQMRSREGTEDAKPEREMMEAEITELWATISEAPNLIAGCIGAKVISSSLSPQLEKAFRATGETEDDQRFVRLIKTNDDTMMVKESIVMWCLLIALAVERRKELEIMSDLYLAFDANGDDMMQFHEFYHFVRAVSPSVTQAEAEELFIFSVGFAETAGEMNRKSFMNLIFGDHLTIGSMMSLESLAEQKRAEIIASW
eukprot:GEMP01004159.1.p1 GENE.GEMP01004159.1~~GEMP01004159.1.p1  ORF type:complete len:968 (+),score=209.90 GEMP01004159.1:1030-3933(+)